MNDPHAAPPATATPPPWLIVVGASAGGVPALLQLVAALPADLNATVLIVLHIGAHPSLLPQLLSHNAALPVANTTHGERLQPGTVRLAPSDRHLLVHGDHLVLSRGPKEHHARPAIDPLFRSAALAWRERVIGVVLTGLLDDGTAGLQAIKHCGGLAVVQDPADAVEPSMPRSALAHVAVDHCLPLAVMPMLLTGLAMTPSNPPPHDPPERLVHEQALALGEGAVAAHLAALGQSSGFACPECHGGLWLLRDTDPPRYRCHTGHAYTERSLQHALAVAGDEAGWNALRALQERQMFIDHLLTRHPIEAATDEALSLMRLRGRLEAQIAQLRAMLADPTAD